MAPIRFKAKLWAAMKGKGWTFATLPKAASAKLPKRGRVPVRGTINGAPFSTSAFPDGKGSHTIQINAAMRKAAGVDAGDTAAFVVEAGSDEVKVKVPADLRKALAGSGKAQRAWEAVTPKARAEWVAWVEGAKRKETRIRRLGETVARLKTGDKRPSD